MRRRLVNNISIGEITGMRRKLVNNVHVYHCKNKILNITNLLVCTVVGIII